MDASNHHVEAEVTVSNRQGFHARPITRFVDLAMGFSSNIKLLKGNETVDGKSPMEMMLLAAVQGTVLKLIADGPDAPEAIAALTKLINDKFGED
jgi:phosphocarrier protein